jgi:hypothetical protein
MYILKNEIKIYNEIFTGASDQARKGIPTVFTLPIEAKDYLNLAFFKN